MRIRCSATSPLLSVAPERLPGPVLLTLLLTACSSDPSTGAPADDSATDTSSRPGRDGAADGGEEPGDGDGTSAADGSTDALPPMDGSSGDAGAGEDSDSGGIDAGGEGSGEGFCGDIDILFVIDSSGSMGDNQRSLVASFPGFVQGMRTQLLDAPSFHVGITTSSDNFDNGAGCSAIGSLVTRTGGPESSNRTCGPYASGRAWMDHLDPNLEEHFACAAQVGVGGSDDERMMRGALNAVNPANTGVGACNEGFARPDALLVMVLISDEDDVPDQCDGFGNCEDQASGGSPDEWVAELAGYRGGSTEDVVVLALVGRRPDNPCGAVVNSRLLGFARRFGAAGYVDDICAESYDGFFTAALPVIAEACAKR
jgi:hypothetical protein